MSIDPHYITDYTDQIRNKIREYEGEVLRIYSDGKGIPTMGIGFALFNERTVNKQYVYSYRGGSFEALQADLQQYDIILTEADRSVLDQVLAALNNGNKALARSLVPPPDNNEINTGYVNPNNNPFSFTLTADKVNRLFTATLSEAENVVRSKIGCELFNQYAGSKEMVAMVSMAFNGPGLLGAKFVGALQAEDRAEVWFQIRYQSNGNQVQSTKGSESMKQRLIR